MKSALIVDDHPVVRAAVKIVLQSESFKQIHEVSTGEQVLEMIREHLPQLVVLDLNLPGLSGLEVIVRIKANFPARIAFKVSSKIDSRTILDAGGAEQLIGKGDMLISYNGELTRLQCAFVDTPEVEGVTEFIGDQRGYPQAFLLPEYVDEKDLEGKDFDLGDKDPLFEEAARLIVSNQVGSTSLLQRRMKLGYNRAGRLMDQLEAAGLVDEGLEQGRGRAQLVGLPALAIAIDPGDGAQHAPLGTHHVGHLPALLITLKARLRA